MSQLPDTPTTQAVAAFAREAAPAFLVNHSYRTYLFGAALIARDVDHEAGSVAAMIHDLGLTDAHRADKDFGERGAELAARFLSERAWGRDRIRLVQRAILRHTRLLPEGNPTARVVQLGAQIDVTGRGLNRLDPDLVAGILRTYPRLDFAGRMRALFLDEARRHPRGSFVRLERTVRLSERFAANPMDRPT